ncbi:hypothetical protein, partial [Staphylococcus sp. EGD-HP3]|uniref:hypothetical protein n=1 Tax=Staphylococcus sp. EGD-HP3 TaxID=1357269 RepID=UPI000561B793
HPCRGGTTKSFFQNRISVPLHVLVETFFILAVADCIENALQTELVSMLVILAGVGRRNHFFKIGFLSHSLYILELQNYYNLRKLLKFIVKFYIINLIDLIGKEEIK